jgi:acetamidase/formamidase
LISACLLCTGARAQSAPEKIVAQKPAGKHYVLAANKDTVHRGWYDPTEKPKLIINSGDTVSIETGLHGMDEIKPGVTIDEIVKLRMANDGGGPQSVTGPIYVNDAEPGDTMEIRITKIVMKDTGFNFNLPGKQFFAVGLLASEFPEGYVQYFKLNTATMTTEFKPGIVLPLRPFPGNIAVGPDPNEPKKKLGLLSTTPKAAPARCVAGRTVRTRRE